MRVPLPPVPAIITVECVVRVTMGKTVAAADD